MDNVILIISGGVGKNIMATSLVRLLKETHPKAEIIVITPHLDVWKHNPHITEALHTEKTNGLYRKKVKGQKALVLSEEPYHHQDFIYKKRHLMDVWSEMCGVKWDNSLPELFFNDAEKKAIEEKVAHLSQEKPVFLIQTNGGAENQAYPISWARDLPLDIAEKVVTEMNSRGYASYHLRRANQPALKGAPRLDMSLREALYAVSLADKRLLIDSVFAHASAAWNTPAVVPWILNKPEIFGYGIHKNIEGTLPKSFRHHLDSYLEQDDITGVVHQCPYNTLDLFNADELVKLLEENS